jgi:hypothetical protein
MLAMNNRVSHSSELSGAMVLLDECAKRELFLVRFFYAGSEQFGLPPSRRQFDFLFDCEELTVP